MAGNPAIRASIVASTRRSQKVNRLIHGLQYVIDVLMLVAAFVLGYIVRMVLPLFDRPDTQPEFARYLPTLFLHVVIIVTLFYLARMYHQPRAVSRIDQARNVIGQVTLGSIIVFGLQELLLKNSPWDIVDYPRSTFFYVLIFSVLLVVLGREVFRVLRNQVRRFGIDRENLLIIGVGKIARNITGHIKASPQLGFNIVGIVSPRAKQKGNIHGIPILGDDYQQIPYLLDAYSVHQVIIALPDAQRTELVDLVSLCRRGQVDIKIYPDMFAYMAGDLSVDELGGMPLVTVRDIALRGWKLSLKRGLDVVGSVLGLIFLSPVMLLTAILIRMESAGSVFYAQERMGLDSRPFQMIKFRSMREDAEDKGPGWTVKDDPRVTNIGRFMRRTSWDEIPQLINVFIGEMSLVGPRPERPVYVYEFRDRIPRYMERHREKAGMTGWAQVNGLRGDTSIEERTDFDLWYVENWSLWLDIKIIIRTVVNIFLRRDDNAY